MDPFDTDAIWTVMNRTIAASYSTGQPIGKAGIDLALFDLTGRVLQLFIFRAMESSRQPFRNVELDS